MLVFASMIPFVLSCSYGLINLDDYRYLVKNDPGNLFSVDEGIWMPLTNLSYVVDRLLYGTSYGGYHFTSLLIHALNALLVWMLLRKVFGAREDAGSDSCGTAGTITTLCCLGTLLWSVHPLRCESAVWLASRKDVLSFFFELLALNLWFQGGILRTALSCLAFALGALCKPSVMTFPVLCLLLDAFVKREVRPLRYVIPFLMMLFIGAFAAWQQTQGGATNDMYGQPLWARLVGAAAAFGIYVRNTLWPQWLAPQCIKTWPVWPRFWVAGVVISSLWGYYLVVRLLAYWDERKTYLKADWREGVPVRLVWSGKPDLLFAGMAWFAVAIAPMLGIMSFGYHAFADRFTYIPAVGLSIVIVEVSRRAISALPRRLPVAIPAAITGVVLVLMAVTWRQTQYWENDKTLFTHTLEVDGPRNAAAHAGLASWYFEFPHDLERCVQAFEAAIAADPRYVIGNFEFYIFALCELGRFEGIGEKLSNYWKVASVNIKDEDPFGAGSHATAERDVYLASKVMWWTCTDSVETARKSLDLMRGDAFDRDPIWLYVRWKFCEKLGDQKRADYFLDRLLRRDFVGSYTEFRYLRNKYGQEESFL